MDQKEVARYALSFIGGKPGVSAYYNDDETKEIDIMACIDEEDGENITYATIGLCQVDIGRTLEDEPLRAELMMAATAGTEVYGNILASAAFVIQDAKDCDFGMVIDNVVGEYAKDSDLRHVVLMYPVFWPEYKAYKSKEATVAWLLAVPITEKEKQYIMEHGIDAFDALLEERDVDISDLSRACICVD